ncbi:MAG: DUF1800 domain-containing protein, partial [Pseudomonadota bacterium]
SYRGWQMALAKVKPIPRHTADPDLSGMVRGAGLITITDVVDHFAARMLSVPIDPAQRTALIELLRTELGTDAIADADSYMEDGLRLLVQRIMALPEYQLG